METMGNYQGPYSTRQTLLDSDVTRQQIRPRLLEHSISGPCVPELQMILMAFLGFMRSLQALQP